MGVRNNKKRRCVETVLHMYIRKPGLSLVHSLETAKVEHRISVGLSQTERNLILLLGSAQVRPYRALPFSVGKSMALQANNS